MQFGSALVLSLLLAACGENRTNGVEERPAAESGPAASQGAQVYSAAGEITAIEGDQVTIAHGPVQGLGWPAMTMTFRMASPEIVQGVTVGDRIAFGFTEHAEGYTLTSLSKDG